MPYEVVEPRSDYYRFITDWLNEREQDGWTLVHIQAAYRDDDKDYHGPLYFFHKP